MKRLRVYSVKTYCHCLFLFILLIGSFSHIDVISIASAYSNKETIYRWFPRIISLFIALVIFRLGYYISDVYVHRSDLRKRVEFACDMVLYITACIVFFWFCEILIWVLFLLLEMIGLILNWVTEMSDSILDWIFEMLGACHQI